MIKIAIVDDHLLFRRGLSAIINNFSGYKIVLEACNGNDLISHLNSSDLPDIVLLDITMPIMNGYDTANWLRTNYPEIRILALSMLNEEKAVIRMVKNGANGYILKDTEPNELMAALDCLLKKDFYINELIGTNLAHSIANNTVEEPDNLIKTKNELTARELEFIKHVCMDLSYKQIADQMFLSPRTIDGYRDSLFHKFHVQTRIGLVLYAIKHHLVDL